YMPSPNDHGSRSRNLATWFGDPSTGSPSNGVPNVAHLTAKARTGRVHSATRDAPDLDRLLGELRALWDAAAKAQPARRYKLHGKIVQAIERLKKQLGEELTAEHPGRTSYPLVCGELNY